MHLSLSIQNGVRVVEGDVNCVPKGTLACPQPHAGSVNWAKDPFGFSVECGGNVPTEYVKGPIAGLKIDSITKPVPGQIATQMSKEEWNGPATLLEAVIKPYVTALVEDFETGFVNLMKIDNKTMRQVLFEKYKDETVVTFIETAGSEVTGYFEKSASEVVIDNMDFGEDDAKWYLFEGGTSKLTDAMYDSVRSSGTKNRAEDPVKLQHQVQKLTYSGERIIASGVVGGLRREPFNKDFSHVITTMTNHAFRLVDTADCKLSVAKRTAIRCLTCKPHRPRTPD